MAGTVIQFRDEKAQKLLRRVARELKDTTPLMRIIGSIIRTSVVRNFELEGRPQWAALSPITAKRRGAEGPILRRQGAAGGLMGSINIEASDGRVSVGTNKIYAAVHQFGARAGSFGRKRVSVRRHTRRNRRGGTSEVAAHSREMAFPWGDIPARPFLMVQPEDMQEITAAAADYLEGL
jgi:phage virion morphogenesis protein